MSFLDKLKSRKFLALVGGVLIAIGTALTGEIAWSQSINAIIILVVGYLGVEGAIDFVRVKYGH